MRFVAAARLLDSGGGRRLLGVMGNPGPPSEQGRHLQRHPGARLPRAAQARGVRPTGRPPMPAARRLGRLTAGRWRSVPPASRKPLKALRPIRAMTFEGRSSDRLLDLALCGGVPALAALAEIATRAAVERVLALLAEQGVLPFPALQCVLAGAAAD